MTDVDEAVVCPTCGDSEEMTERRGWFAGLEFVVDYCARCGWEGEP